MEGESEGKSRRGVGGGGEGVGVGVGEGERRYRCELKKECTRRAIPASCTSRLAEHQARNRWRNVMFMDVGASDGPIP